jgi:hypothetical protein
VAISGDKFDKFSQIDPLSNPYRPGAGTAPPALVGRDGLISNFGITLERARRGRPGKSMMPIGLRGVGKTVLLNQFQETAEHHGMVVAFLEAPETGDFRKLLAVRLRSVLLDLERTSASDVVKKALGILRGFTYQLPDGSAIAINVDAYTGKADSGVLSEDLADLFTAVGEAAEDQRTGVLIAIDEVQYLDAEELAALITAIHRTSQLDLPVVLVGAGLPQLPGLAGDAKSYAERLFDFPTIGSLDNTESRDVLSIPANKNGVEFEAEALDFIVDAAQGYPYFLQEWGHHAWDAAEESPVSGAVVRGVESLVDEQLDQNFFKVRLDRLTPAEKTYLRAMAELGPGPHRSGDIASKLGVKVESVAPRRSGLIKKGMVYSPAHGDTAFTVPLFDRFLRRELDWNVRGDEDG